MSNRKFIFSLLLLSGITVSEIYSQSTLNLKENSGALASFALSNIIKLTFDSGNISVNKTDGSISAFPITNLRYLSFSKSTSIIDVAVNEKKLTLFHDPSLNQINVQFESATSEETEIQIIDIKGMFVYQKTFRSQVGHNYSTISLVNLKSGLYLCRFQNGNKLETCKFIKH